MIPRFCQHFPKQEIISMAFLKILVFLRKHKLFPNAHTIRMTYDLFIES